MDTTTAALWALAHTERAALADDLEPLTASEWASPSLCGAWTVEQVVAHLTAAASVGPARWLLSMAGARFRPDVHNARRLAEQLGGSGPQTLARFRAVVSSSTAASGSAAHVPAWLGEVVVHAEDVRRPLGIVAARPVQAFTPVAEFFVARNFTVNGRTAAAGLRLEATDGPFAAGAGPLVTGTTAALTMAMAGRTPYLDDLDGPGLPRFRAQVG